MIGPINKCVDTLRVRVFTLEEETYKYLMEGNKQIKKKKLCGNGLELEITVCIHDF